MLVIRNAQREALRTVVKRGFADRMIAHLREFVPEVCEDLSDRQLLTAIDHGIARAARYGVSAERDVCKYLTVMCTFGLEFDDDEALPWVSAALDPSSGRHATFRVDDLMSEAIEQLRENPQLQITSLGSVPHDE